MNFHWKYLYLLSNCYPEVGFLFEFGNLNSFFNSDAYKLLHEELKWDLILYKLSV